MTLDTALILIDVQEKLMAKMHNKEALTQVLIQTIKAFQILEIPIILTEQYPQGLGKTISEVRSTLYSSTLIYEKESFSACKEGKIAAKIKELNKKNWVLIGVEAHVCVLQTAFDLCLESKKVTILQDATASRNLEHKESALKELEKKNCRITCLETLLFELLGNAKHPKFKEISQLLR